MSAEAFVLTVLGVVVAAYAVTGVWYKLGDKVRATETQADTTIV